MSDRAVSRAGTLFCFLCAVNGHYAVVCATTLVVIRTPTEVVIATDSAGTIQGDGRPASTETVCKIYRVDANLFFAVSGLVRDPLTGFSIPDIVAAAGRRGDSLPERIAKAERDVRTAVLRELPALKARDPAQYANLINSKGAVSVVFGGVDGTIPAAVSFSLSLAVSPGGDIETSILKDSCPGNCPNGTRAFWSGEGSAIENLRASRGLPALSMPELARYLVQTEIDSMAPGVAGPIDVLRILASGPVWVQKKAGCPVMMTR